MTKLINADRLWWSGFALTLFGAWLQGGWGFTLAMIGVVLVISSVFVRVEKTKEKLQDIKKLNGEGAYTYFCDDNNIPRVNVTNEQKKDNLILLARWAEWKADQQGIE